MVTYSLWNRHRFFLCKSFFFHDYEIYQINLSGCFVSVIFWLKMCFINYVFFTKSGVWVAALQHAYDVMETSSFVRRFCPKGLAARDNQAMQLRPMWIKMLPYSPTLSSTSAPNTGEGAKRDVNKRGGETRQEERQQVLCLQEFCRKGVMVY